MPQPTLVPIQILVPEIEKTAFKQACKLTGTTMTMQLRKSMFEYCKTAQKPDMAVYEDWLNEYQLKLLLD
jgi:hypothetical protein